jgi:hypothetical protein
MHVHCVGSGIFTSALQAGDGNIEKYLEGLVEGWRVFQNDHQCFKYKLQ